MHTLIWRKTKKDFGLENMTSELYYQTCQSDVQKWNFSASTMLFWIWGSVVCLEIRYCDDSRLFPFIHDCFGYGVFCASTWILALFFLILWRMSLELCCVHWLVFWTCNQFGYYDHFNNTNFSSPWTCGIFSFCCVFFNFFQCVLCVLLYISFTSLVKVNFCSYYE